MEDFQGKIRSMDTDLSEKFVVTACEDALVRLFSVKEKSIEPLAKLVGHSAVVTKAVFINQGELIASSDFDGKVIVWKLEGHAFAKKLETKVNAGPVYDIAVRHEAGKTTIFCGCDSGVLKTLVVDTDLKTSVTETEVHRHGIVSVSCNENFVATGSLDCSAALISKDGSIEYLRHHSGAVNGVGLAGSDDGEHTILATCSEDGKVVFVFKEGKKLRTQEISIGEPCYSVDWSKTGFVLTVGYGAEGVKSYVQGESGDYEEVSMEQINS